MHAQSKEVLKTKLQVEQSSRIHRVTDAVMIDECVMLWSVRSPTTGTVEDYIIKSMGLIVSLDGSRLSCRHQSQQPHGSHSS